MKKVLISLLVSAIISGVYFFQSGLFTKAFASAARFADGVETAVRDKKEIEYENACLKSECQALREEFSEFSNLRAENKRLRRLMEISDTGFDYIAMRVIAYGENSSYEKIYADCGRDKGIEVGQTVIYSGGFAGVVDDVGDNWCSINTLMSEKIKLSVTDTANKKTYLLNGKTLDVSYIDSSDNAKDGDVFTASGLSDNVPQALKIGSLSLTYKKNGTIKSAKIKLPEDYFNMKYLLAVRL